MEIIEIGAVWARADSYMVETFQALVRPVVHAQLTAFFKQLAGINQSDVDSAEPFPIAAAKVAGFAQRFQSDPTVWGSWGSSMPISSHAIANGTASSILLPVSST
jgi:inhibitor of KinA sporulation pathway (predicted exonuclease)